LQHSTLTTVLPRSPNNKTSLLDKPCNVSHSPPAILKQKKKKKNNETKCKRKGGETQHFTIHRIIKQVCIKVTEFYEKNVKYCLTVTISEDAICMAHIFCLVDITTIKTTLHEFKLISNSSIYSIPRENLCPPVQREAFKKANLTIKQIRNTITNATQCPVSCT